MDLAQLGFTGDSGGRSFLGTDVLLDNFGDRYGVTWAGVLPAGRTGSLPRAIFTDRAKAVALAKSMRAYLDAGGSPLGFLYKDGQAIDGGALLGPIHGGPTRTWTNATKSTKFVPWFVGAVLTVAVILGVRGRPKK